MNDNISETIIVDTLSETLDIGSVTYYSEGNIDGGTPTYTRALIDGGSP